MLSEKQKNHVRMQLNAHDREPKIRSIYLDDHRKTSFRLYINKNVFGSDIMSSGIYVSRFLFHHQKLFQGKMVLDIGCGPGTLGLIMAKYGAKFVTLTDISPIAIKNTHKNIKDMNINKAEVMSSDLFENISSKRFDVIIFNHPYFSGQAENFDDDNDLFLRKTMLGGTELIKNFFKNVSSFMNNDSIIIMSYFHFAGKENDPETHVMNYKLNIVQRHKVISREGLQLGDFTIYIIKKTAD